MLGSYVIRLATAGSMILLGQGASGDDPAVVDFQRDVQPVFTAKCSGCHGAETQESGLRLDQRSSLLRGGDWGEPAIVPGDAQRSFLWQVVSGDVTDLKMPPADSGEHLTSAELQTIRHWIEQGAEMPLGDDPVFDEASLHWAFRPVAIPPIPTSEGDIDRHPIDAFIVDRLRTAGLSPAPRADRRTLIRRLYLVMLGLPPTPEEVEAFVRDDDPQAWARLVDRVLMSPHYGERWARHWLDLIRFGETNGFETNRERPTAWRFRDWVIDSLNEDKPYDQFVREQLAGDALEAPLGTGFLVAGPHDIVKSPDINLTLMQRQDELTDIVNSTGTAFLGLTLGCARCHNHKFDPVTQRDFYALQAVFAGVDHAERSVPLSSAQEQRSLQIDREIAALEAKLIPFTPGSKSLPAAGSRLPVNARFNVEEFAPRTVKFVRFTIHSTNNAEPCLDELALFAGADRVGLKSQGAIARCSSALPGYDIHQLDHIHDGEFGNSHSWISHEAGQGWIEIELPKAADVDRIEWGRDREGKFRDRLATSYEIEVALEPGAWQLVATSDDRVPYTEGEQSSPQYAFAGHPPEIAAQGQKWLAQLETFRKQRDDLRASSMAYVGTFHAPEPTHRLYRGEPLAKREVVPPGTVSALGTLKLADDAPEQERRLQLARWIASAENPLTARVIVNRLWQFHFGTGFVDTPSDFGRNGTAPSHPELLDWLAAELVTQRWSLKQLHREILRSQTWQQASTPHVVGLRTDGASRLLWRFPPRRLEAEAIRDSILAVAGTLNRTAGGPGFSAFEVELENVRHFHPKSTYTPDDWRRMIYMTKVRQEQDAVFGLFDCPDGNQVAPVRSRSTTPLQALNLLNSPFVQEQARHFAARLERDAGSTIDAQIRLAVQLCGSRSATEAEVEQAREFIAATSLEQFTRAMLNSNEFLFIP